MKKGEDAHRLFQGVNCTDFGTTRKLFRTERQYIQPPKVSLRVAREEIKQRAILYRWPRPTMNKILKISSRGQVTWQHFRAACRATMLRGKFISFATSITKFSCCRK